MLKFKEAQAKRLHAPTASTVPSLSFTGMFLQTLHEDSYRVIAGCYLPNRRSNQSNGDRYVGGSPRKQVEIYSMGGSKEMVDRDDEQFR